MERSHGGHVGVHAPLRDPSSATRSDTDMTHESTTPSNAAASHDSALARHRVDTQKSDDMRTADTANGENPDDDTDAPSPATQHAEGQVSHPTGERQARENLENDPPA